MRISSSAKLASSAVLLSILSVSGVAAASNAFEFPDTGVEQYGRGGAWVARASDPLAAWFNPGALATQKSGVTLDVNLIWQKTCFNRVDANGNPEQASGGGPTATYPAQTCNSNSGTPFPNPSLAVAYRVNEKLALGFFVGGPNAAGKAEWPDAVMGTNAAGKPTAVPSPTRYMLLSSEGLVVNPTLSVAYSVTPTIHVGAGFTWGIASLKLSNVSTALLPSTATRDDWSSDIKATLDVKDLFVPGAVAGALWEAADNVDLGAWVHWSDAVRASGDAHIEGFYYNAVGSSPEKLVKDPSQYCPIGPTGSQTTGPQNCTDTPKGEAKLTIPAPFEAKIGTRFHMPRAKAADAPGAATSGVPAYRDPIANDVFDVELDVTYAHNSSVQDLQIRFPTGITIPWAAGGAVPPNADVPHHYKDVVGLRLGGDYVIIPDRLAVRAGGFFETQGQDPAYANIDFVPAQRLGVSGGGTLRLGPVDAMVAAGHVFGMKLDNHGHGSLPGLAGNATACYVPSGTCYRTANAVNDGFVQQAITVVSVGATYRW